MKSIQLSNYCRWDEDKGVNKVLNEDRGIDVTAENGIYFRLAIKHNNIKILKTLLEYYENTQLQNEANNQPTIFLAKQKLQTILQDAVKSFDISREIQEVLVKYLPTEEVLKIIKDNMSEVGLHVPCLDTKNLPSELDDDIQKVFGQLHNIKMALNSNKYSFPYNYSLQNHMEKQEEVIDQAIYLLQKHYYYVNQDMGSIKVNAVTDVIYNNELLNHPDLLKESLKAFNINQILDMSLNLDQGLVDEAVNNNDSSLVLAGLISLAEENNYE
jgi:hypothetical protein